MAVRSLLILFAALLSTPDHAQASVSYSRMIVFGDSLSDDGNLYRLTGGAIPPPDTYFRGRSSNGRVWPEVVSSRLGIPLSNRAFAGARSGSGNVIGNFPGLAEELATYFRETGNRADPRALYVLWAAANDFLSATGKSSLRSMVTRLVDNLVDSARRLQVAGARDIAVSTMPDLGLIPYARFGNSPYSVEDFTDASLYFNALLAERMAELGDRIMVLDVLPFHRAMVAQPQQFGLENVRKACLATRCENPDSYMYWDDRHPTRAGHALLASIFVSTLNKFHAERADSFGIFIPSEGLNQLSAEQQPGTPFKQYTASSSRGTIPVSGDWNGDGKTTLGYYHPDKGLLRLGRGNRHIAQYDRLRFGPEQASGWWPVAGDWNGDGRQTIGLYNSRKGRLHLRLSNQPADTRTISVRRGGSRASGWIPIAGDWDNDGIDSVGFYETRSGWFRLWNDHLPGAAYIKLRFGPTAAWIRPLAGDWDGDGTDTPALLNTKRGRFLIRNQNSSGPVERVVRFGRKGRKNLPLGGDWSGIPPP